MQEVSHQSTLTNNLLEMSSSKKILVYCKDIVKLLMCDVGKTLPDLSNTFLTYLLSLRNLVASAAQPYFIQETSQFFN
jgi:hypothetical protein